MLPRKARAVRNPIAAPQREVIDDIDFVAARQEQLGDVLIR